jgi:predicted ATPase
MAPRENRVPLEIEEGAADLRSVIGTGALGYLRAGRYAEGLSAIAEARDLVTLQDEYWWEPELHRLEGDLVLASGGSSRGLVKKCYQRALGSAHRHEAKSWELRAAVSLTHLWHDQGRGADARDLLAPVYGWFTDGFDTPDLKDAKSLLAGWTGSAPGFWRWQ